MRFRLKNVGIIKDSTIDIDGITVITGKNNSGKTTVGKVIYSLISATEELFENASADIIDYAKDLLCENLRKNDLNLLCRGLGYSYSNKHNRKLDTEIDSRIILLNDILNRKFPEFNNLEDMTNYISFVIEQVFSIDNDLLVNLLETNKLLRSHEDKYINHFDQKRELFINDCKRIIETIERYSDFIEYEKNKIVLTITKEFSDQIAPIKIQEKIISEIQVEIDNKLYNIKLNNKEHCYSDEGELFFNEANNVIFIDDVTVIDSACPDFSERRGGYFNQKSFDNYIHCYDHKSSLLKKLIKRRDIVNTLVNEETFQTIEEKLNSILVDDIIPKDGKYVLSSDGLDIINLAMGSKLFAIIKMLLKNGSINKHTILILDEPESHLHPEWQNIFSEIVAILVKEIGIKVIITSHSPNFVLGIQAYSMKYNLEKITNFYVTEKVDEYLVNYKNVNENLNVIYSDFAKYFSKIKALYDNLTCGEHND